MLRIGHGKVGRQGGIAKAAWHNPHKVLNRTRRPVVEELVDEGDVRVFTAQTLPSHVHHLISGSGNL
jgi:hypothetical protein